jgi:hypothetical protein
MAEKFKHSGASSGSETYIRIARCLYSGQEGMYDTPSKYWNEDKQVNLNIKFMKNDCTCETCREKRKEREKLIAAMRRDNDTDGLRALGCVI